MLNVTKPTANRLDIELTGTLDAEAMRSALDQLIANSEGITNGTMLYTIADFELPTLGAMAVEFLRMPKLMGLIGRFDKCAVLSDTSWIRTAAEIEGVVIPSLSIRSFALRDKVSAEAWLTGRAGEEISEEGDENFPV